MKKYGKIYPAFYNDEAYVSLSDAAHRLIGFLLASDYGNLIGCFRLTTGLMNDGMGWQEEKSLATLDELVKFGFIKYDKKTKWVLVCDYLKPDWQPIQNYNQAQSAMKLFKKIPKDFNYFPELARSLLIHKKKFTPVKFSNPKIDAEFTDFIDVLEKFSIQESVGLETHCGMGSETCSDTSTVITVNSKQYTVNSNQYSVDSIPPYMPPPAEGGAVPEPEVVDPEAADIQEIFEFWKETMHTPRSKLDDLRKRRIRAALKKYSKSDICAAIIGCSQTPHNMGHNETGERYDDIELILRNASKIEKFIRNFNSPKLKIPTSSAGVKTIENGASLFQQLLAEEKFKSTEQSHEN